jgi:DNA-binding response OmpR family regulator
MPREIILLVHEAEHVREAVAGSLARAGSSVEAVSDHDEAAEFLVLFRPDWILVSERQAHELLLWVRRQDHLRGVAVVLLPDLALPGSDEDVVVAKKTVA